MTNDLCWERVLYKSIHTIRSHLVNANGNGHQTHQLMVHRRQGHVHLTEPNYMQTEGWVLGRGNKGFLTFSKSFLLGSQVRVITVPQHLHPYFHPLLSPISVPTGTGLSTMHWLSCMPAMHCHIPTSLRSPGKANPSITMSTTCLLSSKVKP